MSNQLGLRTLVHPGDEVVTDTFAHIVRAGWAVSRLKGHHHQDLRQPAGRHRPRPAGGDHQTQDESVPGWAPPRSRSRTPTTSTAGRCSPSSRWWRRASWQMPRADPAPGWCSHLERPRGHRCPAGRIWSAVRHDRVCFSRAWGAPIGSMLLSLPTGSIKLECCASGSAPGCVRVGILAAAADFALKHQVDRLAEDHRRAGHWLKPSGGRTRCRRSGADTNIVRLELARFRMDVARVGSGRPGPWRDHQRHREYEGAAGDLSGIDGSRRRVRRGDARRTAGRTMTSPDSGPRTTRGRRSSTAPNRAYTRRLPLVSMFPRLAGSSLRPRPDRGPGHLGPAHLQRHCGRW